MRIGIDFDNTIVNYEGVFHAAAIERGLIPADLPKSKNAVRDLLNSTGRKDDFTQLQGYVYGSRMDLAKPYAGVVDFLHLARRKGHALFIVSHKTKKPLQGPAYDMHESARGFLRSHDIIDDALVSDRCVFFEERKETKVARIASLSVDVFIDDLPEIFAMAGMPAKCRRILFSPNGTETESKYEACRSWQQISSLLLGIGND